MKVRVFFGRYLLSVIFGMLAVTYILQYLLETPSASPFLAKITLMGAMIGLIGFISSIFESHIRYYPGYTKDPTYMKKWKNFVKITISFALIYITLGTVILLYFQSIPIYLMLSLVYGIIMGIIYKRIMTIG